MKRIIGLIICILVISSFSVGGQKLFTNNIKQTPNVNTFDDDVPIWQIGEKWIFEMETLYIETFSSSATIRLDAAMKNLVFELKTISETQYQLDISGNITGTFYYNDGAGLVLGGDLTKTELSGSVKINKANLAFEEAALVIDSVMILREYPFPINIPIKIPFTITLSMSHSSPRPVIDFPLFDGKIGLISEAYLSVNIKVESIILKIINIFMPDVPSEIVLDQNLYLPMLQYSANAEEITVIAGTYNGYRIELFEGAFGSIFYSPEIKNIIKIEVDLEISGELHIEVYGELKNEITISKTII